MSYYASQYQRESGIPSPEDFKLASRIRVASEAGVAMARKNWPYEWGLRLNLTPLQVQEILLRGFDSNVSLDVRMWGHHSKFMFYMGREKDAFAEIDYITFKDDAYVYNSKIDLNEDLRSRGMGKKFMRNMIEFDMAMGSRVLRFVAGYENGGYTWASMGAEMNMDPFFSHILKKSSDVMKTRLGFVKNIIPECDYDSAAELAELSKETDPMVIARDLRHVFLPLTLIPPEFTSENIKKLPNDFFVKSLNKHFSEEYDDAKIIESKVIDAGRGIRYAFESAVTQRLGGLSLPRYMLTCTQWSARIDYNDNDQMSRIGNWLGGWKTIGPAQGQPVNELSAEPA